MRGKGCLSLSRDIWGTGKKILVIRCEIPDEPFQQDCHGQKNLSLFGGDFSLPKGKQNVVLRTAEKCLLSRGVPAALGAGCQVNTL